MNHRRHNKCLQTIKLKEHNTNSKVQTAYHKSTINYNLGHQKTIQYSKPIRNDKIKEKENTLLIKK